LADDPIVSQLVRSSLFYASEEMGIALRNSSYSPNIKERMDHSAALFDSSGRLIAQAEHIPVHLGSLPWGLSRIIDYCRKEGVELDDGSMVVANNPYIAGTHLNDITVVKPIYFRGELVGYGANKAHHSDVGGKVPGSISIDAKSLFEEGMILNPTHLVRNDALLGETLSFLASNTRTPKERMGDIKAQVAANFTGNRRVIETIEKWGKEAFLRAIDESFAYSERMMKARLSRIKQGRYSGEDYVEDPDGHDIKLKVTIELREGTARFDYTGTDQELSNPLNTVYGVTLSGVHYLLRTVTGDDVPANYGAFSCIDVVIPERTVLNASYPHPVAAGNTETVQRNADLLYKTMAKALPDEIPAAAGGSMNNIMFGGLHQGKTWAYYETVGVGLGGKKGQDGLDGIQSNMTNTMNTPIEEIERSLPIRVNKYEFRPDSCGPGEFRGGCGLIREFEMTSEQPTTFTIVADRFRHDPWGLQGGKPGQRTNAQIFRSKHGARRRIELGGKITMTLEKSDVLSLNTAGGGGYGKPGRRDKNKITSDLNNNFISRKHVAKYYSKKS
jgi:N-methylhydantoinase B